MCASRALTFVLCLAAAAHAAEPVDGGVAGGPAAGAVDGGASDAGAVDAGASDAGAVDAGSAVARGRGAHAGSPIAEALDEFDFGDYEGVVARLRPLVDRGARELHERADRIEALRVYGIACTLTDRKAAAEGAFLLLLREEPSTRLDPALVRPEAVAFFDQVRARHRAELLAAYRRTRPRYHWWLNLVPTAGQFQNRQLAKGFAIGGTELALLAGNLVTGVLLDRWQGDQHTFPEHRDAFGPLRAVNIASFAALLAVTVYGIVDGFVVGARRQERERQIEARIGF